MKTLKVETYMDNKSTLFVLERWQVLLGVLVSVVAIVGQFGLAISWKTNIERDILERTTRKESRNIAKEEVVTIADQISELREDVKMLINLQINGGKQ